VLNQIEVIFFGLIKAAALIPQHGAFIFSVMLESKQMHSFLRGTISPISNWKMEESA